MRHDAAAPIDTVALAAKVAFLQRSASYPDATRSVESVETHMSWVFLTERFAYKLKKAVRFAFLDFSTMELRRHYCEEEIRLNRILAPNVYIGTLPLTSRDDGSLSLGGDGTIVDWLVKMHRLPADRMLDRAIAEGTFTASEIEAVAQTLAHFYREAPRCDIMAAHYLARFEADVRDNRAELLAAPSSPGPPVVHALHEPQTRFLEQHRAVLERRVAEGRIVEAHGDLRPEHILLGVEPQIIDRLEFNLAFRTLDPLDDLALFAVDCDALDASAIADLVVARYRAENHDDAPAALWDFYCCYRACLRAKLALWHLREHPVRTPERWPVRARRYLEIAQRYAERLSRVYVAKSSTSEAPS